MIKHDKWKRKFDHIEIYYKELTILRYTYVYMNIYINVYKRVNIYYIDEKKKKRNRNKKKLETMFQIYR